MYFCDIRGMGRVSKISAESEQSRNSKVAPGPVYFIT